MEEIRFIDLEVHSAFENMAIDEAIMLRVKEGKSNPTLRFYRWSPSAVSIGTFQGMKDEVDVEARKKELLKASVRPTTSNKDDNDDNDEE